MIVMQEFVLKLSFLDNWNILHKIILLVVYSTA